MLLKLKSENDCFRNKLSELKEKIIIIESTSVSEQKPINSITQLCQDSIAKEKCAFNVVIYGLPESLSTGISNRIIDDQTTHLSDILEPLSPNLPLSCKLIHLSKLSTTKPRSLKVICSSKDQAAIFVSEFSAAKKNSLFIPANFKMVSDRTTLERQLIRTCHTELKRRTGLSEADLTISYLNGVPKVMQRRSKTLINTYLQSNKTKPSFKSRCCLWFLSKL